MRRDKRDPDAFGTGNPLHAADIEGPVTIVPIQLELSEEQRQLVLLALATLALRSPGFDDALNEIACRIDNTNDGRAQMYDGFRANGRKA